MPIRSYDLRAKAQLDRCKTEILSDIKERWGDIESWRTDGGRWVSDSSGPLALVEYAVTDEENHRNITAIAAAPDDVAWLVSEVERLRALLAGQ